MDLPGECVLERSVVSATSGTWISVRILIASSEPLDECRRAITEHASPHADEIMEVVRMELDKQRLEEKAAVERKQLLGLFVGSPIFVEEIKNRYWKDEKYAPPWYRVTTIIGHFVVGWRKRVIEIDWTETTNELSGMKIFPNEDTTRSGPVNETRYIHAWSVEDAQRYVTRVMETAGSSGRSSDADTR